MRTEQSEKSLYAYNAVMCIMGNQYIYIQRAGKSIGY